MRCIQGVIDSDLSDAPEIILVDNGSTDESVTLVRERYPMVKIIEAGRNLGFAAANNRAFAIASGTYLLLVNTDAMLSRDCARLLTELMERDPDIGMVGPQLLNEDGTPQTSYEVPPTPATEILNRSLLKRLFPGRYPGKNRRLTHPEPVDALIGAVMMIRSEALAELNGFDEDYFFFLEETDLAVRMRKSGRKVMHHPEATAVHLQGGTAKSYKAGARIEFYRSRYIFFQKHYGIAWTSVLKAVMAANLFLNVIVAGVADIVTLGKMESIAGRFRVRYELWKWHVRGCPAGPGLPRD